MSELARLRWQCRRGMRELDVLFKHYLSAHYAQADAVEQAGFREVLSMDDPDLYAICLRRSEPPAHLQAIFERLRAER